MNKKNEDPFYKEFYDFCKQVFDKCCDVEEELFFPNFNTKELKEKIKNEDIQHQEKKSAFIEKIDKTLFFTHLEFCILKAGDDGKPSIKQKINIHQFISKIEQHLETTTPAFKNFVRKKTKEEKNELLKEFKYELYTHQFKRTDDNLNGDKIPTKTGIELPKFSFSAAQNITNTRRYDAMEFLRELLQFKETKDYYNFFSYYLIRLYNNYNARGAENKEEIQWREVLKGKLKEEIKNLPLKTDDKESCYRFLSYNETYSIEYFLKERLALTPEIREIISKLKLGRTISLDKPLMNNDGKEKGSLVDNKKDEKINVEAEIVRKITEERIRILIPKYIDCFHHSVKQADVNKYNLNSDKLQKLYKDVIRLIFSGQYDLTNIKGENLLVANFTNEYEQDLPNEVRFILHGLKNKDRNFLYDPDNSVLRFFHDSIVQKINDQNINNTERQELNELREYVLDITEGIRQSRARNRN